MFDVWEICEYWLGAERIATNVTQKEAEEIIKEEIINNNPKEIWMTKHKTI